MTITSNGNQGTLGGTERAVYLGTSTSASLAAIRGGIPNWFNPAAFGEAVDGTPGGTGRGILTGPGINNWDFSIFKNTNIRERVRTQLRVECFNLFNHTQFSGIGTGVSGNGSAYTNLLSNNLGQVTGTRDPRTLQLAIKLYF